jgi:hypothetical protein
MRTSGSARDDRRDDEVAQPIRRMTARPLSRAMILTQGASFDEREL